MNFFGSEFLQMNSNWTIYNIPRVQYTQHEEISHKHGNAFWQTLKSAPAECKFSQSVTFSSDRVRSI